MFEACPYCGGYGFFACDRGWYGWYDDNVILTEDSCLKCNGTGWVEPEGEWEQEND